MSDASSETNKHKPKPVEGHDHLLDSAQHKNPAGKHEAAPKKPEGKKEKAAQAHDHLPDSSQHKNLAGKHEAAPKKPETHKEKPGQAGQTDESTTWVDQFMHSMFAPESGTRPHKPDQHKAGTEKPKGTNRQPADKPLQNLSNSVTGIMDGIRQFSQQESTSNKADSGDKSINSTDPASSKPDQANTTGTIEATAQQKTEQERAKWIASSTGLQSDQARKLANSPDLTIAGRMDECAKRLATHPQDQEARQTMVDLAHQEAQRRSAEARNKSAPSPRSDSPNTSFQAAADQIKDAAASASKAVSDKWFPVGDTDVKPPAVGNSNNPQAGDQVAANRAPRLVSENPAAQALQGDHSANYAASDANTKTPPTVHSNSAETLDHSAANRSTRSISESPTVPVVTGDHPATVPAPDAQQISDRAKWIAESTNIHPDMAMRLAQANPNNPDIGRQMDDCARRLATNPKDQDARQDMLNLANHEASRRSAEIHNQSAPLPRSDSQSTIYQSTTEQTKDAAANASKATSEKWFPVSNTDTKTPPASNSNSPQTGDQSAGSHTPGAVSENPAASAVQGEHSANAPAQDAQQISDRAKWIAESTKIHPDAAMKLAQANPNNPDIGRQMDDCARRLASNPKDQDARLDMLNLANQEATRRSAEIHNQSASIPKSDSQLMEFQAAAGQTKDTSGSLVDRAKEIASNVADRAREALTSPGERTQSSEKLIEPVKSPGDSATNDAKKQFESTSFPDSVARSQNADRPGGTQARTGSGTESNIPATGTETPAGERKSIVNSLTSESSAGNAQRPSIAAPESAGNSDRRSALNPSDSRPSESRPQVSSSDTTAHTPAPAGISDITYHAPPQASSLDTITHTTPQSTNQPSALSTGRSFEPAHSSDTTSPSLQASTDDSNRSINRAGNDPAVSPRLAESTASSVNTPADQPVRSADGADQPPEFKAIFPSPSRADTSNIIEPPRYLNSVSQNLDLNGQVPARSSIPTFGKSTFDRLAPAEPPVSVRSLQTILGEPGSKITNTSQIENPISRTIASGTVRASTDKLQLVADQPIPARASLSGITQPETRELLRTALDTSAAIKLDASTRLDTTLKGQIAVETSRATAQTQPIEPGRATTVTDKAPLGTSPANPVNAVNPTVNPATPTAKVSETVQGTERVIDNTLTVRPTAEQSTALNQTRLPGRDNATTQPVSSPTGTPAPGVRGIVPSNLPGRVSSSGQASDATVTGPKSFAIKLGGDKRAFTGAEIALVAMISAAGTARVRAEQKAVRIVPASSDGTKPAAGLAPVTGKGGETIPEKSIKNAETGNSASAEATGDTVLAQSLHDDLIPEGLLPEFHIVGDAMALKVSNSSPVGDKLSLQNAENSDEDAASTQPSKVLVRPTYLLSQQDTLITIAEELFHDANLCWLIADLNQQRIKETKIDGKRVIELSSRQELELPVWQDIVEFYQNRQPEAIPENLVTIVTETEIDRELTNSTLSIVMGGGTATTTSVPAQIAPVAVPVPARRSVLSRKTIASLHWLQKTGHDFKEYISREPATTGEWDQPPGAPAGP